MGSFPCRVAVLFPMSSGRCSRFSARCSRVWDSQWVGKKKIFAKKRWNSSSFCFFDVSFFFSCGCWLLVVCRMLFFVVVARFLVNKNSWGTWDLGNRFQQTHFDPFGTCMSRCKEARKGWHHYRSIREDKFFNHASSFQCSKRHSALTSGGGMSGGGWNLLPE